MAFLGGTIHIAPRHDNRGNSRLTASIAQSVIQITNELLKNCLGQISQTASTTYCDGNRFLNLNTGISKKLLEERTSVSTLNGDLHFSFVATRPRTSKGGLRLLDKDITPAEPHCGRVGRRPATLSEDVRVFAGIYWFPVLIYSNVRR